MPEKSDMPARHSAKAKAVKGVKRPARIGAGEDNSASRRAEKKKPASSGDRRGAARTSRIGRASKDGGWKMFFAGAASALGVGLLTTLVIGYIGVMPVVVPDQQGRLQGIENRLDDINKFEEKIRDIVSEIAELDRNVVAAGNKVARFEARITDANPGDALKIESAKWESRFIDLVEDVQELRHRINNGLAQSSYVRPEYNGGLLLAVGQLRSAVFRGMPYVGEWELARALAKSTPRVFDALEPLASRRNQGVATRAELKQEFPGLARSLIRAESVKGDPGWWDLTLVKLSEVVSIRPIGSEVAGDDAGALTARAETSLASGQLAEAIIIISKLDAGIGLASGWLDAARARLDAESSLDELTRQAIALTSKEGRLSANERVGP